MKRLDELPACPTCGARCIYFVSDAPGENGCLKSEDRVGFACGAKARREWNAKFLTSQNFPNGRYTVYHYRPWSEPTGCRNAEEVIRMMRAGVTK